MKTNRSGRVPARETAPSGGIRLYRGVCRSLLRGFGWLLLRRDRRRETAAAIRELLGIPERDPRRPLNGSASPSEGRRIWFHAASVGELESLWPLVERAAELPNRSLVLTVFSSSAYAHLHRGARKLVGAPPLFVGYSPLEGAWAETIATVRPDLFVTAKYEAWPEMWDALGRHGIPLAIIGAKPRSSLLWARRILRFLRGRIPNILFFSFDAENAPGLERAFPGAAIHLGSDPRWDRVFQRSENSPARVADLQREFGDLPRPWGALGSAWAADLAAIPGDGPEGVPGTLWVIPHRTDPRSVAEIEILLRDRGFTPVRTATPDLVRPAGKVAVLVDEMGFLAELYRIMDWAFVGGGFGSSIHSTIEPAIYGLPIYGGPRGQEKFDEIGLLKKEGQLRLFGDEPRKASGGRPAVDLRSWLARVLDGGSRGARAQAWRSANEAHRGASDRIWSLLLDRISGGPDG